MAYLILVRHGQSQWNLKNLFTGWINVPLSEQGIKEAKSAGRKVEHIPIHTAFTSTLGRAQETLMIILSKRDETPIFQTGKKEWYHHFGKKPQKYIPIIVSEKLNERYYGDLQGLNKDAARKKWGKEKVHMWRRSYATPPPHGESLQDVVKRAVPYFKKHILSELDAKKNVLVAAHGNSLRAIIKHIEGISDNDIPHLELGTGKPIIYKYEKGKFMKEHKDHTFDRPLK